MGLIGGIARTAVIAGTATAVSNRVSRRQARRWAAQDQAASEEAAPQYYPPPPPQYYQPPQYPPPEPPTGEAEMSARIAQLKQLGELKAQGILTDAEFEVQKQRILAS